MRCTSNSGADLDRKNKQGMAQNRISAVDDDFPLRNKKCRPPVPWAAGAIHNLWLATTMGSFSTGREY
jgi:hypothetical protein